MPNQYKSKPSKQSPFADIYKRKKFLGITYWGYDHRIFDLGQVDEVVYLLNNPQVLKQRLEEAIKSLNGNV